MLKGTARVMDFSQGTKHIFTKLFLQVVPLTCLTSFCTDWVILFSCQSNLLLGVSHLILKYKQAGKQTTALEKQIKTTLQKNKNERTPRFYSITLKPSKEGTLKLCMMWGGGIGWGEKARFASIIFLWHMCRVKSRWLYRGMVAKKFYSWWLGLNPLPGLWSVDSTWFNVRGHH